MGDELEIRLSSKGSIPPFPRFAQKNTVIAELTALDLSSFQSFVLLPPYIASHDLARNIYVFNMHTSTYKSIHCSLDIDSLCFMKRNPDQLIVTFNDKSVAIIDWRTINIIAQFEAPYRTPKIENIGSAIMLVLETNIISMIDLKSRRLLRQLQLDDECISIQMDETTLHILTKRIGLTTYDLLTLSPQIRTVYKENT